MAKYMIGALFFTFVGWMVFDVGMDITGRGTSGVSDVLAKVNGEKISVTNFYNAVRVAQEQQRRSAGSAPTGLDDQKALEGAVLENLIQQVLLQGEFERRGIEVRDDEIIAAAKNSPPPDIMGISEFQTEGKFDLAKYQRYVNSGADPAFLQALEARYREEIPRAKLFEQVTADVYIPDAKLWQAYRDQHDSMSAAVVHIDPRSNVPDSSVRVTDAEISAYYNTHRAEFTRPQTAFLTFAMLTRSTNAADSAAALTRAKTIRQEIAGGADFAEVAKRESSDSGSGSRGGDLGEVKLGAMVPAFEKGALALRPGQLSEPVLSPFGYHLIKLESKTTGKYHARHILIPIELAGDHREQVEARADSMERHAAEQTEAGRLDTIAAKLGVPLGTAPPLSEGNPMVIGRYLVPDVGSWAFGAVVNGETSPVIETAEAYYVFRLDSLWASGIPPLDQVREQAQRAAMLEKKKASARELAGRVTAEIQKGASLTQAGERLKLNVVRTTGFSRAAPAPALNDPEVIGAAFGLGVGQVGGPYEVEDGVYFVEPLFKKLADSTAFVTQRDGQRLQVFQAARQARVRQVLSSLRDRAKVVDNRKALEEAQKKAEENTGLLPNLPGVPRSSR